MSEYEAVEVIPNIARKMLEGFLAFRFPELVGSYDDALRKASDQAGVSKAVRQRVLRYLHQQSHNEDADATRVVPLGEGVIVLACAMEVIRSLDQEHFEDMCQALDLEAAELRVPGELAGL